MGGAEAVAASLTFQEQVVEVRTPQVMGFWTWFLRQLRRQRPLTPVEVTTEEDRVRAVLRASSAEANHLAFELPLAPGERITGFGERFHALDQRGWKLECWTEEGAVGLGERLSPLLTRLGVPWNPWPKGPAFSYKPVPWFLSSRGYGVLLRTAAPVFFDVGASRADLLRCEAMTRELEVIVLYGPDPKRLVQRMVELTDGHPRGLPDWALAPWLDALGGQERVRQVADTVRTHRIPCSAIWAEDWQGMEPRPFGDTRWSYDSIFPVLRKPCRDSYPDIEGLIGELHDGGFKFLAYYYPYVNTVDDDFAMADERGYLLHDPDGRTKRIKMFMDWCGQVDLTNPEARAWYKEEMRRGLKLGFDGWMADFGEYTPVDVVTHDGEDGLAHHNRYPLLWAELNRELFEEERPDGDFVFFSRSGAVGQQRYTPVFWTGDSNTDFERWDGLPSNLRGLLTAGLSGMSVWTVDVGGYMCITTRGRDRETLARWTELGAFLAVMRTHHGTHVRRCVQFDHDEGTLAHFATYARFHTALFPLRKTLLEEAKRTGLPPARPLLLEHPQDAQAWSVEDQFLLGPHLLVAPVVERGAERRRVYLPAGHAWVDVWTGERRQGAQWVEAAAPVGRVPLYLRSDGILPTFDAPVDTLVRRDRVRSRSLVTLDDAERSLAWLVGPDFRGPFELYDGTVVERVDAAPGSGAADGDGQHALLPGELLAAWPHRASAEGRKVVLSAGAAGLVVRSPHPRRITAYAPASTRPAA
ncbi:MAG: TIM-barrel domain-containing protein [Myxococcota bacterium]